MSQLQVESPKTTNAMPDYSSMHLEQLKEIAKNYGLRPASKQSLVSELEFIYKYLNHSSSHSNFSSRDSSDACDGIGEWIKRQPDLYTKILKYETIDFQEIHSMIQSEIKVSKKDLAAYFDKMGLCYLE